MTQQHPITPPPELVQQWWDDFNGAFYEFKAITTKVFQAGADQELEACCEWIANVPDFYTGSEIDLRAARRPKPPSLKEQALEILRKHVDRGYLTDESSADADTIRRALEQLDD
jgi:hypothetical protein